MKTKVHGFMGKFIETRCFNVIHAVNKDFLTLHRWLSNNEKFIYGVVTFEAVKDLWEKKSSQPTYMLQTFDYWEDCHCQLCDLYSMTSGVLKSHLADVHDPMICLCVYENKQTVRAAQIKQR